MTIGNWWSAHGTKIIGFGAASVGALEFIDSGTLRLIETALGPKWGALTSHAILMASGLLTAYRGYTNSQRLAAQGTAESASPPQGGTS